MTSIQNRMSPPLEVRFAAGDEGLIEGYASAFGGPPDSYGDVVAPGAFKRSLREHGLPAMLWSHDQARPVGRWLEAKEDAYGLLVRGALNLSTSAGRDAHAHVKAGDATGISIGFNVTENGFRREGSTTVLTDVDLFEASIVALPANRRARISGVKSLNSKSDLIDMLREGGLAKSAAARVAAGGWAALAQAENPETLDAVAKALGASLQKIRKL